MSKNEETVLAESMIRIHGLDAAVRASDRACTYAFMGDDMDAALWRRVMAMIATLSRQQSMVH